MKPSILVQTLGVVGLGCEAAVLKGYGDQFQHVLDGVSHLLDKQHEKGHKKPVDSENLQELLSQKALKNRAEKLYEIAKLSEEGYGHPTRVIGSPGHNATIEYIIESLGEFGGDYYDVWKQEFEAVSGSVNHSEVSVDGDKIDAQPMSLTPGTPKGKPVSAQLELARDKGCEKGDYKNLKGKFALVVRGECAFGDKSNAAGEAGVLGLFIYNNEDGDVHGTLGEPKKHHVPTFGLSKKNGEDLKDHISGRQAVANVTLDAKVETIKTYNVLAETKDGDKDNVVMLGGHSDSVEEGPGINDDGSGTNSLLEVAKALTEFKVKNAVRFAWWAAEEEGLLGSNHYANTLSKEENHRIRLFMDYDMMASPNFAYQVYDANNKDNPEGSEELRNLYVDFYEDNDVNYTFIPFDGRSDYVGFITNDIPGGGIATGAEGLKTADEVKKFGGIANVQYDPCYHQLCDNLDNLAYDAWLMNTRLIGHSVATYAKSLKHFPKRSELKTDAIQKPTFKYRGHYLAY